MKIWNHYCAGVEDVWCLLAVSVFSCVFVTARLVRAWKFRRVTTLARDETGATYMLPLVLTMPFYVLLITMIIECTLMLTAKIGSVGAAYAAARAAAVWLPYETAMPKNAPDYTPLESRQNMVRLAAARAMFPYASGSTDHASEAPLDDFLDATADQQVAVFQAYSGNQGFDVEYLKRKFAYAYNSSTVQIEYLAPDTSEPYGAQETPAFNAKIQLTLRYEAPIHTYGIGRIFGERSQFGKHFVRPVVTTVVIENEGVKNALILKDSAQKKNSGKSLGIKYYERGVSSTASPQFANVDTNQRKASKYPEAVYEYSEWFNGIEVPVYRVPRGVKGPNNSSMNGDGQYSAGVIYLVHGADDVTKANETRTAEDDAYDRLMNGELHDETGRRLTYLEGEIRSDLASVAAIDRMNIAFEFLANLRYQRDEYVQRIEWMIEADLLIQIGYVTDARALQYSGKYRTYLQRAIDEYQGVKQ